MGQTSPYHVPVLVTEVVELLRPIPDGVFLDATFGAGGHTRALLEAHPGISVLAVDRDPDAAAQAETAGPRVTFRRGNFAELGEIATGAGVGELAGALFDLGVSSHQLDEAARGFSYHREGPLDMRMGPDAARDAATVVGSWTETELAQILRRYGEERFAGRIAAAIVANRPIRHTAHLAAVVAQAVPAAARRRGHPARRVFQAIRIAVNDELDALAAGLDAALDRLAPGGRVAVIAYHSLEDRMVKRRFTAGAAGCICPPDLPVCGCGRTAELRLLTRRVVRPTDAEVAANPRARSARLRAAEKIIDPGAPS